MKSLLDRYSAAISPSADGPIDAEDEDGGLLYLSPTAGLLVRNLS